MNAINAPADPRYWTPSRALWEGATVICLGGGSSLAGFDFQRLRGRHVLGCNDSYQLGADLVPAVCFGDNDWYYRAVQEGTLAGYKGLILTNHPVMLGRERRVRVARRENMVEGSQQRYLMGGPEGIVGWWWNTGLLAIELAACMGAGKIILLGYDMRCGPAKGRSCWYRGREGSLPQTYVRFLNAARWFAPVFRQAFPDVTVINAEVERGVSSLDVFDRRTVEEVL